MPNTKQMEDKDDWWMNVVAEHPELDEDFENSLNVDLQNKLKEEFKPLGIVAFSKLGRVR